MGVSGSGKTTVGNGLARRLNRPFIDGDDFHPESNIVKMTAGIPLDEQYDNIDDIISDMVAYRRIIDITIDNDNQEVAEKETLVFNDYIDKFRHFYEDEYMEEEPEISDPDLIDTVPISDTMQSEPTAIEDSVSSEDSLD